ncbi:speckle-type POZ protein-like [Belonocnema kinseyi]|uniref:speckle-type POZ protein-like n=1 Tax=Belonocnema kinseyi TaxID=2817044 RepID=UPI00143D1E47|nr:speckle-type POZ protein-like [Belonocnema kinseyi]
MTAEASLEKVESALVKFDYNEETTVKNPDVTTFSWILKNFDAIMKYKKPATSSKPNLRFDPNVQCSISLKFSDPYLEPSVTFYTNSQTKRMFEVEFYILNYELKRSCQCRSGTLYVVNGSVHSALYFMYMPKSTQFIISGSLIISCDIWSQVPQESFTTFRSNALRIPKSELCLSDFTIMSKGKKFPAHRAILAARSQVFSAMLHTDMLEETTDSVNIGYAEPEIVLELLRFIYTDNVMNIEKFTLKHLELAERFDLNRLKIICVHELVESISVSSSLEILIIADRHKISALDELMLNFIRNRLGEIVALADYDTFRKDYPDLMEKILRHMI